MTIEGLKWISIASGSAVHLRGSYTERVGPDKKRISCFRAGPATRLRAVWRVIGTVALERAFSTFLFLFIFLRRVHNSHRPQLSLRVRAFCIISAAEVASLPPSSHPRARVTIFAHCSPSHSCEGARVLYERARVLSRQVADNWLRVFRSVTMFVSARPRVQPYRYFIISKKVIVRTPGTSVSRTAAS